MIRPKIRDLYSPGLERPALPPDTKRCCVHIQAAIGPADSEGEEIFEFTVATPEGLLHEALPRWGRGLLIVEVFSWSVVEHAVERLLAHAHAETWTDSCDILCKDLNWEFDDYAES